MEPIIFNPIGIIRTPYQEAVNIPIQGTFDQNTNGKCELFENYAEGLKDLEHFSHAILLYYFHKTDHTRTISQPFLEKDEHGIFSIRSPYRPNKIGFSIVKIKLIRKNMLEFTEVDILDNTPLLDIKPYIKYFDHRDNVRSGWVEKHFTDGKTPNNIILKKK